MPSTRSKGYWLFHSNRHLAGTGEGILNTDGKVIEIPISEYGLNQVFVHYEPMAVYHWISEN